MNNAEYWEKRQLKRYTSGEKKLIEHYKKLEKVMEQSRKDIEAVINKFYIEYASENEISYAEAQKQLNKREIGELNEFIERVNEHMGEYDQELNNMSIKARITRYEALLKQIDAVLQRTYTEYEQASLKELTGIYEDTYYRACFDIDQYNGFHKEFAQLDQKGIMEIINYPFDGRSFSDRIWKQKDFLFDKLTQNFTQMLVQGTHPKTLSKEFAKQFKSREYDAYRLLHTEYSYLAENASQKAYEEDEVPAYKYLATLDSRTCGVCGKLDGKIIKMGDGKFGVNMPPLHPLCRCTTVPYYEELDEIVTRIARNKDGENIEVPHDMSYEEWKNRYIRHSNRKIFSSISNFKGSYNENAKFEIDLNLSQEILNSVSSLCKEVIRLGAEDGKEHGFTLDLITGETKYYTNNAEGEVFGSDFFDYLKHRPDRSVISIHNHADNRGFSYVDINTFVTEKALYANIAACHNGKAYCLEECIKGFETGTSFTEADLFEDIINELREELNSGNIFTYQFSTLKEERCCERIAQTYFKKYEVIE